MVKVPVSFPIETIFGGAMLFVVPGAPLPRLYLNWTPLTVSPLTSVPVAGPVKSMSSDPDGKDPGPTPMTVAKALVFDASRNNKQQIRAIRHLNCAFIDPSSAWG
jgi:hypothetical protein